MKRPIRITFLGPQKGGKSSIISSIFKGMKIHETSTLESTLTQEKENYLLGQDTVLEITEIPGSHSPSDFKQEDGYLHLEDQDIFIYVLNCQMYSLEMEIEDLLKIFEIIHDKNPTSWFYIFYHQVDLEIFINAIYEQDRYIEKNFYSHIQKNIAEIEISKIKFLRTSLYDKSVNYRISEIITNFLSQRNNSIGKILEKINDSSKTQKIFIFDLDKRLFLFESSKLDDAGKLNNYQMNMDFFMRL